MSEPRTPRKKPSRRSKRDYVQFRAPPAWIDGVKQAAATLCLSVSAFVRLAVIEKVQKLRQQDKAE